MTILCITVVIAALFITLLNSKTSYQMPVSEKSQTMGN